MFEKGLSMCSIYNGIGFLRGSLQIEANSKNHLSWAQGSATHWRLADTMKEIGSSHQILMSLSFTFQGI